MKTLCNGNQDSDTKCKPEKTSLITIAVMERSKASNILITTRLLSHFDAESVTSMKCCIFEQLGCINESQFLCKVLNCMRRLLSDESSTIIRNKAIKLADSQLMITNESNRNNSNLSVGKYIEQQYTDRLSTLHSNIIDYFATFLTKQESIALGHLNKQLYIETQKRSYQIKRDDNEYFYLDSDKISRLNHTQSNPYAYSFARRLELSRHRYYGYPHHVDTITYGSYNIWQKLFQRVCYLRCNQLFVLCTLPLETIFRISNTKDIVNCYPRRDVQYIDEFEIGNDNQENLPDGPLDSTACKTGVETFCDELAKLQNRNEYQNQTNGDRKINCDYDCNWYNYNIRKIKQLTINVRPRRYAGYDQIMKRLYMTCAPISQSIHIVRGPFIINTLHELKTIFHKNLKEFRFGSRCIKNVKIDIKKKHIESNNKAHARKQVSQVAEIGMLEKLEMPVRGSTSPKMVDILNIFDKYMMRRNIKCYTIDWRTNYNVWNSQIPVNEKQVFDKIFLQDYNKNPLLEKIKIKIWDNQYLFVFAKLLIFFQHNYQILFSQRKLYLKHFQCYEIEFSDLNYQDGDGSDTPLVRCTQQQSKHAIFNQSQHQRLKRKKEYSIDEKVVEIFPITQEIECFAGIYQNVFDWLEQAQQKKCQGQNEFSIKSRVVRLMLADNTK